MGSDMEYTFFRRPLQGKDLFPSPLGAGLGPLMLSRTAERS